MRIRKQNQAFSLIDPQVSQEIQDNPLYLREEFSKNELRMLNRFMYFQSTTGKIFFTQSNLARYAGLRSRQYANAFIGKLIKLGIVISNYRHKTSCQYKVSSFFNGFSVRKLLRGILPALAFFPIVALEPVIEKKWTQYNSIYLNTLTLLTTTYTRDSLNVHVGTRNIVKKGDQVKEAHLIPDYVEDIQSPSLTFQQKLQLSEYSRDTIRYALIQLQRQSDVQSPVGFLLGVCRKHSARPGNGKNSARGRDSAPSGDRKEVRTVSPAVKGEIKDAAFWKRDDDILAHRNIVDWAAVMDDAQKYLPTRLVGNMKTRYMNALRTHNPTDCHLCAEYGQDYEYPTKLSPQGQKRHDQWQAAKATMTPESLESHKGETESSSIPLSTQPYTPAQRLAQMAARQLAQGGLDTLTPRRKPEVVPVLVERGDPRDTYIPEIPTRIELDQEEVGGCYDYSECEEIFPLS